MQDRGLKGKGTIVKRAVVAGTFDPITLGHVDIIRRSAHLFDKVIVGVAESRTKGVHGPLFSLDERVQLAKESVAGIENVEVRSFGGLLVDFVHEVGAQAVVKGLREVTDFDYEFQQTAMNYQLAPDLETLFIMSPPEYRYLSSSIVRELASFGGSNFKQFVTPSVFTALCKKYGLSPDGKPLHTQAHPVDTEE